jgi:hypothetical protein
LVLNFASGFPCGEYIRIVGGFGSQFDIRDNFHRQNSKICGDDFTVFQFDINTTATSIPITATAPGPASVP